MKFKILLVDDEPTNLKLLRRILQEEYLLIFARNGVDAMKQVSQAPDLVLLDIQMPEMDGHEVCRRLKADPTTRDILIIFITTLDREQDESMGLELGAIDYITKPFNNAIVHKRVRNHLELKRNRDLLIQLLGEKKQQYQILANKEHYIRSLLEQSIDMIVSLDTAGNIVAFNSAAESAFGHDAKAVRDTPFQALFVDKAQHQVVDRQLVETGRFSGEIAMKRRDGGDFPAFVKLAQLRDKETVIGAVGSMRDMTMEKQLARLMRQQRDLEMVKVAVETMKDRVRNGMNGLQLLRLEAEESATVNRASLTLFDKSIRAMTAFISRMERLDVISEIEVGGARVIDVDGQYTQTQAPAPEPVPSPLPAPRPRQAGPVHFNPDQVVPLLKELSALLQNNDGLSEEGLARLKPLLAEANVATELAALEERLDQFDFLGALDQVQAIAGILNIAMDP